MSWKRGKTQTQMWTARAEPVEALHNRIGEVIEAALNANAVEPMEAMFALVGAAATVTGQVKILPTEVVVGVFEVAFEQFLETRLAARPPDPEGPTT